MIVLAAKCVGKPERRDDIISSASAMLAPSRAEAGCLSYDFYERPSKHAYVFFEEWADQAALDAHFQTPHFQAFIGAFMGFLAEPPVIRVYDVAASRELQM